MWSVCGGFLLYFLTSNYLSVLIKPSYQKPVETSEDVIARNLTIIDSPGRESMVEAYKKSPIPIVREIAERTYVAKVSYLFHVLLNIISIITRIWMILII